MTKFLLMSGGAALALVASPAFAQTAPAAQAPAASPATASDGEEGVPADIIVTAQKRSERLQDVPIAVSVVSSEQLARAGVLNIENAQYLVPSLNFRKSGTALNQSLFLRGVGTSTFSIAGEPSITTVVDGVVYQRSGEAFSDLIDIDRIEVLRGPQGTLFGKNSSAGVINIVTKRPGDTFGGYGEAGYFFDNGTEYRVRGALDLPVITDKLAVRLTSAYTNYDGNIFNTTTNRRVNGYEHFGIRGIVVAKPIEDLTLTVIADYHTNTDNCCGEVIGTPPVVSAANTYAAQIAAVLPPQLGDRTRALAQNLVTSTLEDGWGVSLQADVDLNGGTLTSISSYRKWNNSEIRDGDFLPQAYVGGGLNQLHDVGPQRTDTITQELRIASEKGKLIDYVVGGFYSRAYSERVFSRSDIVCTLTPAPAALTPCTAPGTAVTRPFGTAFFGSTFQNAAVFGQATLNLRRNFRLIGGVRYTYDALSVFHSRQTTLAGPGIQPNFDQGVFNLYQQLVAAGTTPSAAVTASPAGSNGVPFRTSTTADNVSGRVGFQYEITPQVTTYFTYSRGYKGPAYNIFYNLTATGTNVIAPETSNAYEIGLKNSLFDGKLVLNIAGYYAEYQNFQANNPDVVAGVIVTRFTNAGDVSTRGVEVDAIYRPTRDLSFNGGFAYTDARVDRFNAPIGANGVPSATIPNGTPLAYAPKVKANLGVNYRWRTQGPVDLEFGAQGSYQSSQLSQFDASAAIRAATTIRAYSLLDLQASIVDPKDKFRITFLAKNVADESFAAAITSGGPYGSFRYLIPREANRYFGVQGRFNF
ncbi:MAG: TonB-dependent receptor [Sphingomonas sp.]|uniref:TonB-dependent receptor n=1 Tax=Sphingomonas sp. TaxID=28214 RepID=UPI002600F2CB|nr:TonB-dependent receptor [Sphingomonas sp.]MBX9881516.1 TonB-dependent receptor [Sphingomonas sp.]